MQKRYISLGLMSGTSGDGVDASLINSDGISVDQLKINIMNMTIIFINSFIH